jgi:hypothetical protein
LSTRYPGVGAGAPVANPGELNGRRGDENYPDYS